MRRALILVSVVAGCGGGSSGEPDASLPSGAMVVSVDQYDFPFDLESRAAHAVVHLSVTGEGDCVSLPLRAALAGDVQLGGAAATAEVVDETLTACGAGWRAGEEILLEADLTVAQETWGESQVGYSISEDANAVPFYYLVSWIGGCDRFAPCDHAPDVFARYHFTITHPADVTVLCPGEVVAGATSTTCTFDLEGGPTYTTFGIVASSGWDVIEGGSWNGIEATIYNRTGSGVAPAVDGVWIGGFLAWMEARFGPYPYGDAVRVVTGPTYWSGFEHPGNIVLDDLLDQTSPLNPTYTDPVNHVLAHELTHQWAGDQTTRAGTYDFVWKEAMAEYRTYAYEAETRPSAALKTASLWKSRARGAAFYPVPGEEPPLLDYYGDVYGPGPMVLFRQLEALFSRDDVLDAIAQLLGTAHAVSVDEVQAALEDTTGADLATYFDRWVRGTGAPTWPRFTVTTTDVGNGDVDVTVTQLLPEDGLYGCAFIVELSSADAQTLDVPFNLGPDGMASATQTVTPGFPIASTRFDTHFTSLAYPAPLTATTPPHPRGWSPWVAVH
jgi:aminopeptidase N